MRLKELQTLSAIKGIYWNAFLTTFAIHQIKIRYALIALTFCLFTYQSKGQEIKADSGLIYNTESLQADFILFRQILEKAHPSLYRYTPKDSIDKYFNNGYRMINHPMSEIEFWQILQYITSNIKSGHTYVSHSQKFSNIYAYTGHSILPFYIYIRNNRLFIKDYISQRDTEYKIGTQILAIDSKNATQIINKLRELISGDGNSNSYKDYKLEMSDFIWLYNIIYGDQPEFLITFKSRNGSVKKKIKALKALMKDPTLKEANAPQKINLLQPNDVFEKFEYGNTPVISYPFDIDSTVILTIGSFFYKDYKAIDRKIFHSINNSNIKNVIIDLRNNGGGDSNICMDWLKYFVKDHYYFTRFNEQVVDPDQFIAYLTKLNMPVHLEIASIIHEPSQIYNSNNSYLSNENYFKGNLFILIDGGTFSAASLFAVALKYQKNCTIIGQETGGGEMGCDGIKITNIKLPQTGLMLRLPLLWACSISPMQNYGKGLLPDITVSPSPKQIYEQRYLGKDPFIAAVKQKLLNKIVQNDKGLPK
jgi:Peptidase family S41